MRWLEHQCCRSFRWTSKDKPVVIICYDSRKDKINKIKKLWPSINAGGTTPESLCYEALMKKWLGGVRGEDNYFINYLMELLISVVSLFTTTVIMPLTTLVKWSK